MPKLKQPSPLLKIVTDRLVDYLAKRCNECSINGSPEELRQVVAFIKEDIRPNIPPQLEADFFGNILSRYSNGFKPREERPESDKRAVLEVIMDRKIDGLHLRVSYLPESMGLEDTHRIRGLRTLELSGSRRYNLETFHLEDLETFICVRQCTDADLQIIGKNCPKLKNLTIEWSKQVTDEGLVALNKCTELRIVDVRCCWNITKRGIQEFLEANEKIEKIRCDFDCFSDDSWSVYPSITNHEVYLTNATASNLRLIAETFPNLTSLEIYGQLDDPACLGEPLLRSIAANITTLYADPPGFSGDATPTSVIHQADLDALHKFCPNIESLSFNYNAEEDGPILFIPPFGRLSELECFIYSDNPNHVAQLQFGVMPNLKTLEIKKFETTTETLESMVLDNDKFPELNYIFIHEVPSGCDLDRIREIVKNKNIDLCIE